MHAHCRVDLFELENGDSVSDLCRYRAARAAKKITIQTFENFQVKMLQIGFCLYRADENAKRLVNIDSHFEQLLIAIMYKCVCISIAD